MMGVTAVGVTAVGMTAVGMTAVVPSRVSGRSAGSLCVRLHATERDHVHVGLLERVRDDHSTAATIGQGAQGSGHGVGAARANHVEGEGKCFASSVPPLALLFDPTRKVRRPKIGWWCAQVRKEGVPE